MPENRLETTLKKLREVFQQEYSRGSQDALRQILDTVKGGSSRASRKGAKRGNRQRAARGSAKALIERVLKQKKTAAVPTIMAAARSPSERKVSVAAVRFELYRGKKDRTYVNSKGQWRLGKG